MQSIFTDVGKLSLQDPTHSALIPSSAGTTASHCTSAAWLSYHGDAHFALASPAGGITVVTLPSPDSQGEDEFLFDAGVAPHTDADCKTCHLQAACQFWS